MSEPVGKSTLGKIGLLLSLASVLGLTIGSLLRSGSSRSIVEPLGALFFYMSPVALGLSCGGLRHDHLKRFAIAGLLISFATLAWFALFEAIKILNRG